MDILIGLILKVFCNIIVRPLQQMSLEESRKSHEILQFSEFLLDFIEYFNARMSRPTLCQT